MDQDFAEAGEFRALVAGFERKKVAFALGIALWGFDGKVTGPLQLRVDTRRARARRDR